MFLMVCVSYGVCFLWCVFLMVCVSYGVCFLWCVFLMVCVSYGVCFLWCVFLMVCVSYGVCFLWCVFLMVCVSYGVCFLWCVFLMVCVSYGVHCMLPIVCQGFIQRGGAHWDFPPQPEFPPPEILKFSMVFGQDCVRSNLRRSKNQKCSFGDMPPDPSRLLTR